MTVGMTMLFLLSSMPCEAEPLLLKQGRQGVGGKMVPTRLKQRVPEGLEQELVPARLMQ